jgi:tetratricopeptide (TPR) repeat protein
MPEVLLIIFAAALIYYVATRVAPQGLIFKMKKDEANPKKEEKKIELEEDKEEDVLVAEGQDLLNKGELEGAEKKFLSAIKIDPNSGKAYHFLGMIYLRQKLYTGAIASLEKACKLDPLNDTAFNNLGLSYFNIQNYEQAIENYNKSISLNDKIAHRYLNLALALQKLKDWDKAAIALEAAAKIHSNPENLTLIAKNYISMGDKKLAEKAIDNLLEIDPHNNWAKRHQASLKD